MLKVRCGGQEQRGRERGVSALERLGGGGFACAWCTISIKFTMPPKKKPIGCGKHGGGGGVGMWVGWLHAL